MTSPDARQGLLPTLACCVLILGGMLAMTGRLTLGFEAWTYETVRRQAAFQGALQAPPMDLRDSAGQVLRYFAPNAQGLPSVYLVDFIYTRCLSVCQALGSEYHRMQEALRNSQHPVRLLSISIDPVHDDQAALQRHGKLHRADPAIWTLSAPQDTAKGQTALRQLGVVSIPDGLGGYVHNGSIHLVDGSGRVHQIFDYDQWRAALTAAQLLAEPSHHASVRPPGAMR